MAISFFQDEVRITMTAIHLQIQIHEIAIDFQTSNKRKKSVAEAITWI